MEKTNEPSKEMDNVLKELGKEPKTIWVRGLITINSDGEIKIFGFTVKKGKK
jgi:hypothetical protein